jgi:Mg2+/Co2+ transporter CorB
MDEIPLPAQFIALALLLGCSAFFSVAETAMMASNRHRLRHMASEGDRGAKLALDLLGRTDKMLGVILLGNNLLNAATATLVSVITIELFGEEKWALSIGTLLVTFAILVFAEITPKILGAAHADQLARVLAFLIWPLLRAAYPVVWFVNLFVDALLWLLRLKPVAGDENSRLSAEELRSLVLESSNFIPQQHRSILLNLFELEQLTVADIMTPRGEIEAIDIAAPIEDIKAQLGHQFSHPCHGVRKRSSRHHRSSASKTAAGRGLCRRDHPRHPARTHGRTLFHSRRDADLHAAPVLSAKTGSAWAWWWMNTARSKDW